MTHDTNRPAFATWERPTLEKFAHEVWEQNILLRKEIEQANLHRKDLESALAQAQQDRKYAMTLARANVDDWR